MTMVLVSEIQQNLAIFIGVLPFPFIIFSCIKSVP